MFILSIVHLPAVIINIFGISMHYASNNALARTTLGNLGGAQNVTVIAIPGCNSKNYNFAGACVFGKKKFLKLMRTKSNSIYNCSHLFLL